MKTWLLFIGFSGALSLYAQEDVSFAKWQTHTVTVDGNDNEWEQPFGLFDNKSGLVFTLTNDKKNIYLCFTDKEEMKTEKLMKAGWSIELSSSEKKRKFSASITFPKVDDPNINLRTELKNQLGIYKATLASVKTKGFVNNNGDIPLMSKDGIQIGIGLDENEKIVYEIAIPVKELMEEDKFQQNELITVDITVNALDRPSGGQTVNRSAGGGAGFGGGRMGGGRMGMGGNRRSGSVNNNDYGGNDRYALFDKVSFKQKFRLVNK